MLLCYVWNAVEECLRSFNPITWWMKKKTFPIPNEFLFRWLSYLWQEYMKDGNNTTTTTAAKRWNFLIRYMCRTNTKSIEYKMNEQKRNEKYQISRIEKNENKNNSELICLFFFFSSKFAHSKHNQIQFFKDLSTLVASFCCYYLAVPLLFFFSSYFL